MEIKTYSQAVNYLNSFINYERIIKFPYQRSLKLERVENLFKKLRINPYALKAIHIAGTKGKGSTATYLAYILANSGFKVGLYTSPHFKDFRERIKIIKTLNSQVHITPISEKLVVKLVREIRPILEKLRFHKKFGQLSFFEVYTALAFNYFFKKNVDFAVLECGLGGRLDATNLCKPLACIITKIDYDHTQQLGNSLREIASEKAGIIKGKSLVVSAGQRKVVREVLKEKAKLKQAKLYFYQEDFCSQNLRFGSNYTLFDYSSFLGSYRDLRIKILGEYQVENASLAIFCFQLLKEEFNLKEKALYRGLEKAFLKGRFQVVKKAGKIFLLDIAHNPLSFSSLNQGIKRYFPSKKVILIFGCSKGKLAEKMLKNIDYNKLIFTRANHLRAQDPLILKKLCAFKNPLLTYNLETALKKSKELSDSQSIIVIAGSFFLVAEALTLLEK
ncbi:MAG TPA: bifunctional folylpolyglutamate synthase/dihydrofolate synthase [Candidatus Omnitrophica bacterium]|nr:MAG: hypothetical protein DRP61_00370 [Candidatus Omnitrophota bacterium]RKY34915.1 MAG: hypothetical protein DRP69_03260 [Candidatus Omnitrophota bacterium]RKY44798.1 MAG: hypothetical protein DRP80_01125 [Candidatus Omnitrophota bacterium]HEC68671.1 bifunctional folylpolyglutamate synthase/dihydrofolate synthase [Candidatus Omnitrophota bacterium]